MACTRALPTIVASTGPHRTGRSHALAARRASSALDEPPLRFPAGVDAVTTFENRAKLLVEQAGAHRELSSSLAYDDGTA